MPLSENISAVRSRRLEVSKIDLAYPLVRELKNDLTLETWRAYAGAYLEPKTVNTHHRGIIVAEYRNYIRGLLCYDVLSDLVDLTTLSVRDVIVPGIPSGQPAARSLLQHLFAIAGAHGCGAIRVDLTEPMKWLAREWSDPQGELFRFPVICFVPGSTVPVPSGANWQTQTVNRPANRA